LFSNWITEADTEHNGELNLLREVAVYTNDYFVSVAFDYICETALG